MNADKFGLVIHGGAGADDPDPAARGARLAALSQAIEAGYAILAQGKGAIDAVQAAVVILEDCPLFNAGRGSVLASHGDAEMDSCLMAGDGRCGAVAAVRTLRNPVLAARLVMDRSPHTLLCSDGADAFARQHGAATEPPAYFRTEARLASLRKSQSGGYDAVKGLGTVGAVALDRSGGLAAATSTGGLTGKAPGRVSDSAIAGAGAWAADGVAALSCTGTGDIFIRQATAHDVACRIEYLGGTADDALRSGLDAVKQAGGEGGIIGIFPDGKIALAWNTPMMNRGYRVAGGALFVGA